MISCGQYDYIEIVCMYRYSIRITLKSGLTIEGIAVDTQNNDAREECIKMQCGHGDDLVKLDEISKIDVCVENPKVKTPILFEE